MELYINLFYIFIFFLIQNFNLSKKYSLTFGICVNSLKESFDYVINVWVGRHAMIFKIFRFFFNIDFHLFLITSFIDLSFVLLIYIRIGIG